MRVMLTDTTAYYVTLPDALGTRDPDVILEYINEHADDQEITVL